MSKALLTVALILVTSSALAKCVVEILDKNGDPVGYAPFIAETCSGPRQRCEAQLAQINQPELKCEVTLDIGGKVAGPRPTSRKKSLR